MHMSRRLILLCTCLTVVSLCAPRAMAVSDEEVGQTIAKMKEWLYAQQGNAGKGGGKSAPDAWDLDEPGKDHASGKNYGGQTALVVLALLVSGESPQNPKLAKAIDWLKKIKEEEFIGTYARGIRACVWGQLPDTYKPMLEADGSWLLETHNKHKLGLFDYTQGYSSRVDNSVTQYGVLGLWQVALRGGKVPEEFWQTIAKHFYDAQNPDGGWTYGSTGNTKGTMTCAGLASLYIVQQQIYRQNKMPNAELNASIDKALNWFDKNFSASASVGGGPKWYYLYGIERVGIASGYKYFNKRDWYEDGAEEIVKAAKNNGTVGGAVYDTAFALMFLARGRYPVWVSKLQVDSVDDPTQDADMAADSGDKKDKKDKKQAASDHIRWNDRPLDLSQFTEYLSDYRETELNWQIVDVDTPAREWANSPILYLNSAQRIDFNDKQAKNIKRYIDFGGTLVCVAQDNSGAFVKSMTDFAERIYPAYKVKRLDPDDPIFTIQDRVESTWASGIMVLSNGARNLIYIIPQDWSWVFQSDNNPGSNPAWGMMTNLWAMTSDRGQLPNRLEPVIEPRKGGGSGEFVVGRLKYNGNFNPEPGAWIAQSIRVANQAGYNVKPVTMTFADLDKTNARLVHLAGVESYSLSSDDLTAMEAYIKRGGTVLIETVGGQGPFVADLESSLVEHFKSPPVPISPSSPIITGSGLSGGYDVSRCVYRRFAVVRQALSTRPRLACINVDGRPAIIVSGEDLSMGMVGTHIYNVVGYSRESARRLMTNIVLFAKGQNFTEVNEAIEDKGKDGDEKSE
ncbi:MAG: DUF4159 domain-containing protein [Phycisphaera sp.]|nr:DUF4159 domain-containing protein [Phycisphaera sp.]